jgi:hypothetical protein
MNVTREFTCYKFLVVSDGSVVGLDHPHGGRQIQSKCSYNNLMYCVLQLG